MSLITEEQLKKALLRTEVVPKDQLDEAIKESKQKNLPLEEILVQNDLIADENLGQLIAHELVFNFVNLRETAIDESALRIIPEIVAKNQKVIAFGLGSDGLRLAMSNPKDLEMQEWIKKKTGYNLIIYYATEKDIKDALRYYRKDIEKTFEEIIKDQVEKAEGEKAKAQDFPIIKIIDSIIEYAHENRASDIHISPLQEKTQVRFRIDGVLHNVLSLPKDIHGLVATRIKVLSKLRTDEHFAAQDGKFTVEFPLNSSWQNEKFDIRVSIIPVTGGENIVMRLLSERSRRFTLESLGFSDKDLRKLKSAIEKPYGMILVTGPTGCGKTTTLYAILKILNKPEVNICTIEDPVEYEIEGISQIQVNLKTNLTFAKGLRSIVRQDPDIIMVGEIRDNETADIAINSAMTGHLVLSTMHANTAATNLPRLMDMSIEPFIVSSSVNVIVAQRLVRKICLKCRESSEIKKDDAGKFGLSENLIKKFFKKREKLRYYFGRGCKACSNTGYSGRIGIFEVLEMEDNIRELAMKRVDASSIEAQAIKNGMTTMIEDGLEKVLTGITTIEEVIRATKE